MGSGKTHWGKKWAATYKYHFFDLDEEVEKREQRNILDIFEKSGEDIFRLLETKMLRDLSRNEHCIISCGGGTPCFHSNLDWMNEKGYTVYLSASPAFLFANILQEKNTRPLIKSINESELLFFTEKKLVERLPFYERASVTLPAEELDIKSFENVLALLPAKHYNKDA